MNRFVLPLIVGSLLLPLGCGGDLERTPPDLNLDLDLVLQPGELCLDQSDAAIPTFEDENLQSAVRAAVSVGAQNHLTCGIVSGLTDLAAVEAQIESLVGIQNLTSLTTLDLWKNSITDIRALSGLTSLTFLSVGGNSVSDINALNGLTSLRTLYINANSITDISPLRGLTSLTFLNFRENSISDISVLSSLKLLKNLDLTHNSISDISALNGLRDLAILRLYNNPITDISPLRGLTNLTELHVHDLPELSNIQPLLNNTGLGTGDRVILMRSKVSCEDAALLQAKGVSVGTNCLGIILKQDWQGLLATLVGWVLVAVAAVVVFRRWLRRKRERRG